MTRVARAARTAIIAAAGAVAVGAAPEPAAAQDPGVGATADSLLQRGRLQEAAWALREAGDTARADEILARLADILRGWPAEAVPLGMDSQGVSYTWRLDHGQGVESIFKVDGSDIFCPECGADREVAAYRIDRLLGFDLAPMTVRARITNTRGDTLSGSAMYYVNNTVTPREAGATKPDRLHLFDAIIGNSDRHRTNWLILGDQVVAIDHNRALEYQPTTRPRTCWETQVDSMDAPGELGASWDRYRAMPADSFRAALAGIETALISRFLDMRPEVIGRIEARIRDPGAELSYSDCIF